MVPFTLNGDGPDLDEARKQIEHGKSPDVEIVWSDEHQEPFTEFLRLASKARVRVTVKFDVLRPAHLTEVVFRYHNVSPVVAASAGVRPHDGLVVGSALPMPEDPIAYERARGMSLVSAPMQDFIDQLRDALFAMKRAGQPQEPPWDPFDRQKPRARQDPREPQKYSLEKGRGKPNLSDLFLAYGDEAVGKMLGNTTLKDPEDRAMESGWGGPKTKLLVTGDSGTGKSLVARLAHAVLYPDDSGERPFVHINCGALDAQNLEFELFGAVPGNYTGVGAPVGNLARAAHGTAFLDEFGDMPDRSRIVLLTYLDNLLLKPKGMSPFFSFTHVVAATNRDLNALIRVNEFRNDLVQRFQRWVRVPSLRERGEIEIITLVDMAAQQPHENPVQTFRDEEGRRVNAVSPDALRMLAGHEYSDGNVRELESIVHRALQSAIRRNSAEIEPQDLDIPDLSSFRPDAERHMISVKALPELSVEVSVEDLRDLDRLAERSGRPILRTATGQFAVILDNVLYRSDEPG